MKITILGNKIELKYTFRGYMIFEQITDHAFRGNDGLSDFITLFYSMVMASNSSLTIEFDEFINWLDEHPEELNNFSEWIGKNVTKQRGLSKKTKTNNKEADPKN